MLNICRWRTSPRDRTAIAVYAIYPAWSDARQQKTPEWQESVACMNTKYMQQERVAWCVRVTVLSDQKRADTKSWNVLFWVLSVTQDQGFKYVQCPSVTIKCKSWTDCFQKDRKWKRLSLHHDMFSCATSSVLIPLWYRSSISGQRDPPIPVRRQY